MTGENHGSAAVPRSPLSVALFRGLWLANLISSLGYMIQSVGASWLMLELTSSPPMVALVQTSITLPIMLLSLLSGAIADNLDRRRVMLTAQCFMLAVSSSLAILTYHGFASPFVLLAFTFLIGCGTTLNTPAWQASVGDIVPKHSLPAAVALNSAAFNIARSAGPALGGAIVAFAGPAAAFLANCATYPLLIGVLLRWRPKEEIRTLPRERIGSAMMNGLRYVIMSPNQRRVIARAMMFTVCASAIPALLPVIVRDVLGGTAITYGALLGAFGAGAVAGALSSAPLRRRMSVNLIIAIAAAVAAAGGAVTGLSTSIFLTVPALIVVGGAWIMALSTLNVTVQLASPRWVLGRSISLYQMAAFGGIAIGSSGAGLAATHVGVMGAMLAAAALLSIVTILGRTAPLPDIDHLNLDPLKKWREPDNGLPIAPQSGPIAVTIHYEIPPSSIGDFLSAMNERRRIRLRDGAKRWTLYRDLTDTGRWIERYHVATWLDYVRHNQRRTNADAANAEAILALHTGPEPPKVYRRIQVDTEANSGAMETGHGSLYSQSIPVAP
ncbi:MAG: MFS transporter [Sphingobium sp.]